MAGGVAVAPGRPVPAWPGRGRGPHGELILEACDKAAELAVIYADALIKELK